MALNLRAEPVPVQLNADGVALVGGTRVTLDTVVYAFNDGLSAEEIVQQYPVLKLADVYAVIAYYLRARVEVEDYLRQREQLAATVRQQNEARFNPIGVRARLLSRRRGRSGLMGNGRHVWPLYK